MYIVTANKLDLPRLDLGLVYGYKLYNLHGEPYITSSSNEDDDVVVHIYQVVSEMIKDLLGEDKVLHNTTVLLNSGRVMRVHIIITKVIISEKHRVDNGEWK